MRILASRHSWYPRTKVAGLRRYAFIGDSNVFGQGVTAGEAFPARAGTLMNEATAIPAEAVNLGVNGYNMWNSWLSFKDLPQVYDGVVFTLCNNDAQLFGRSFEVDYRNADPILWAPDHPYRGAIVGCFDDIADFARTTPVVLAYCNLWAGKAFEEIADTMRVLCEARNLPFINFYAHLVERRIAQAELVVSPADHHPSALAHDAMARHLVQRLRMLGWLAPMAPDALEAVPDGIVSGATDLVGQDAYPVDAALAWASITHEAKRRAAQRLGPGTWSKTFETSAGRASAILDEARRTWESEARTAAIVDRLTTSDRGVPGALNHVEENILRLEELNYAIDKAGWAEIASDLLKSVPETGTERNDLDAQRRQLLAFRHDLERARDNLGGLRRPHEHAWLQAKTDVERTIADLFDAAALTSATLTRAERLDAVLERIAARLAQENCSRDSALAILSTVTEHCVSTSLERLERIVAALLRIVEPASQDSFETMVDVTVRTNRIDGRHPCLVEVIGNYTAPRRLPMRESRYFLPDGEPKRLTMRLPLFYAGRLVLSLRLPPAVAESIDTDIVEVRLANPSGQRTVARAELISDNLGRLLSPQIWLV